MINKKVISNILSKYSLSNRIERVKWEIKDKKLLIKLVDDSKTLSGYVDYRDYIGLKDNEYGIFDTSKLIKCLNILDGDILINSDSRSLLLSDTNYEIKFSLSKPELTAKCPKIDEPHTWSATFDINDEFITRFVKSKDALSELDTFTVETRNGFNGEELVFTIGTNITNTIEFIVENPNINEQFDPIPFNSDFLKEILKANRDYHSGKIRIFKGGIMDLHLHCGGPLYTGYYLIRKQETNQF